MINSLGLPLYAQTYFNKSVEFDTSITNFSVSVIETKNYFVVGQSYYFTHEPLNLIKLNKQGNEVWKKEFGVLSEEYQGKFIYQISENKLIVFADKRLFAGGNMNTYYAVVDTNGLIIQDSLLSEPNYTHYIKRVDFENGYFFLIISSLKDGGSNSNEVQFIQMDTLGNVLLNKRYGEKAVDYFGAGLAPTSDGGYLISGANNRNDPQAQWCLIKIDAQGNQEWEKEYGKVGDGDYIAGIIQTKDQNYIVTDTYEKNADNKPIGRVYKINDYGEIIWKNEYQVGNNYSGITSIRIENADGTYTFGVWTKNTSGIIEPTLMKVSPLGELLWYRDFTNDSTKHQYLYGLSPTSDGGYIMAGAVVNASQDAWVQKVDCEGCDSIQCWVQDSCSVYNCMADSLPNANFIAPDTLWLGDTLHATNTSTFSSGYLWDMDLAYQKPWVNPNYLFQDTGTYTVQLIAYNVNCRDTLQKQVVVVDTLTGISPLLRGVGGVSMFPNPFSSTFTIKLNNEYQPLSLKMFDVYGKLVLNTPLPSTSSGLSTDFLVNVEHLPSGVYILELSDSNTILGREKVVKQ